MVLFALLVLVSVVLVLLVLLVFLILVHVVLVPLVLQVYPCPSSPPRISCIPGHGSLGLTGPPSPFLLILVSLGPVLFMM